MCHLCAKALQDLGDTLRHTLHQASLLHQCACCDPPCRDTETHTPTHPDKAGISSPPISLEPSRQPSCSAGFPPFQSARAPPRSSPAQAPAERSLPVSSCRHPFLSPCQEHIIAGIPFNVTASRPTKESVTPACAGS